MARGKELLTIIPEPKKAKPWTAEKTDDFDTAVIRREVIKLFREFKK